ncbi:MAG: hypothetical protein ABR548_05910 [Actinomycetota bacterium]|nr:hypothetical protein [Actinomycetota bacterium]
MTPPENNSALQETQVFEIAVPQRRTQSPRRPAPAPDRPRHLHAVPGRPAPGRRPPRPLLVVGAVVAASLVLALAAINVLVGQSGVNEADIQKAIDAKQQQMEMLRVDVLRLSAPARVHQRATQIGLIPAGALTYLAPAPAGAQKPATTTSGARKPATHTRPSTRTPGRGGR